MNLFIKLTATIALFAIGVAPSQAQSRCDEAAGLENAREGRRGVALEQLAGCAESKTASAEALVELARIYSMENFRELDQKETLVKVWSLLHEAATRGSAEAVQSLSRLYERGEPLLNLAADPTKAQCLQSIADSQRVSRNSVLTCFGA